MFWRRENAGTWLTPRTRLCSTLIDDRGQVTGSVTLLGNTSYEARGRSGQRLDGGYRNEGAARKRVLRSLGPKY